MKCNSLTAVIRGSGGRSLAGSGIEVPSPGKAFLSIKNHYMYCFKTGALNLLQSADLESQ